MLSLRTGEFIVVGNIKPTSGYFIAVKMVKVQNPVGAVEKGFLTYEQYGAVGWRGINVDEEISTALESRFVRDQLHYNRWYFMTLEVKNGKA